MGATQPGYPRGYPGVYAPSGSGLIAFVREAHGRPVVTCLASPRARSARLTAGSQPGWHPVAAAMTQQAKGGA